MSKVVLAIFIIVFWLSFPVLAVILDTGNVQELNVDALDGTVDNEGFFNNQFTSVNNGLGIYFSVLTMTIPGVPIYMKFIVWILQALSVLMVYLLIRG